VVVRPFRPETGPHTASALLAGLAQLWDQGKAQGGQRSQARLAAESGVPGATVNDWATGKALPRDAAQVEQVGTVLARWAAQAPLPLADWERLLEADQAARRHGEPGPGWPIGSLDPFALEVHRPVTAKATVRELPLLPPYVRRTHDENLAQVMARAVAGQSMMAVLVGESSTGKTRACWEAVRQLPAAWRLWHPFDPTRPEAALADLARVGPRTVVWLNETQLYLNTPGDTGERVAAALTTLLTAPARAPVLVLGTLWPEHWDALTRSGDAHRQARAVLDGTTIRVPPAFTGPALADLRRTASTDPRLAEAAGAADGEAAQFLAGAPEQLARYLNAPPAARAVIEAAMDARRLGHGLALPRALLEAAAPAYLTDTQWQQADEDWLEQALAYTAAPRKGLAGPVTLLHPRPGPDAGPAGAAGRPAYRLADYLDQHGRRHRAETFPPAGFWAAARNCAPADQAALGDAARDRGQYRHAAQLWKNAAERGDPRTVARLVNLLHEVHPADDHAPQLAAAASLDDPADVGVLLDSLREAGLAVQAAALATRAAATVALDDPADVGVLMGRLREAGLADQVAALATRAAAAVALDNAAAVALLMGRLREAGLADQVAALACRLPSAGMFRLFRENAGPGFRFGCEPDVSPAAPWDWKSIGC